MNWHLRNLCVQNDNRRICLSADINTSFSGIHQ